MIQRVSGDKFLLGFQKGEERYWSSRKIGISPNEKCGYRTPNENINNDIQAAISEIAVADFLGIKNFIPTVNNFGYWDEKEKKAKKNPDIEPCIEVRSVQCHSDYPNKRKSLILREHEGILKGKTEHAGKPIEGFWKRTFILAIAYWDNMEEQKKKCYMDFDIKGRIIGEKVMLSKYISNPGSGGQPAYFVPNEILIPFI
jgi:hypothetical protein